MIKEPTNGEIAITLEYIKKGIDEMHNKQDYTNGKVLKNTEYRLKQTATISTFKWLFGFLGLGNIVLIIQMLS